MILHYIKIAFRNLFKYKVQNSISILGLAIGFTAFLLGGYWYYWEHSFDTFHPNTGQTYAVTTTGIFQTADGADGELNQLHESMEKEIIAFPEVKSVCHVGNALFMNEKGGRSWIGLRADSLFFHFFQCKLIEGSLKKLPYTGTSIILTQQMAQLLFGETSCIGRVVELTKETSFTVVAVMKNYPQNSDFKFDYILLDAVQPNNVKRITTYVQVQPGTDIDRLRKKIASCRMKIPDTEWDKYSNWRVHLRSLPEVHLVCSLGLMNRFRNISILAVAGLLAFVSALMNLLVLFIGQQQRKARYNATFPTLGASFRSMIGKNLIELIVPLLLASILSMALTECVFPFYQEYTKLQYASNDIYSNFVQLISGQDLFVTSLVIYPLASILFLLVCLLPIIGLLKRKQQATSRVLRNSLIAGQIFIGALFLITSLAFYQQYRFMNDTDKGIATEHIWQMDRGYDVSYNYDCTPFVEALKQCPYIEDVTALYQPIISSKGEYYCTYVTQLPIEGRNQEEAGEDNCVIVAKNFLSFFGLKMKEGNWLGDDESVVDVVVNETGARVLNIPSLVGRKIQGDLTVKQMPYHISGVLADYYYCPMQYPINKTFFLHQSYTKMAARYMGPQYIYIKVNPNSQEQALAHARKIYEESSKGDVTPEKQFIYLPHLMEEFNRPEKTMFCLFLLLSGLCILISSLGIYSLVALSTEQRKKEIAIRKVNGALFRDMLYLFLKEYLWLALVGNVIALPLGYLFICRWLETYAYHTSLSAGSFILVFLFTCLLVILSVGKQVLTATKVNPAESIKSE